MSVSNKEIAAMSLCKPRTGSQMGSSPQKYKKLSEKRPETSACLLQGDDQEGTG